MSRNPKNYCYVALVSASVFVDNRKFPKEVQEQSDAVLQCIIFQDKEHVIRDITTSICDKFAQLLKAGKGEDDLIKFVFAILSLLFPSGKFNDAKKLGVTLCSSLIPPR